MIPERWQKALRSNWWTHVELYRSRLGHMTMYLLHENGELWGPYMWQTHMGIILVQEEVDKFLEELIDEADAEYLAQTEEEHEYDEVTHPM